MKKIISIVGARPQFIKLAPLSKELNKYFNHTIVHTGQHYDYEMSKSFFDELNIPEPKVNLEVGSGTASYQIGTMLIKLDEVIDKEKPDCVLVYGDTNSTAAGSIVAVKNQIKIAHIEAGLREFKKYIPEESNKLITDILADFFFCPTQTGVDILKTMNINENVYNVGDVMIDLICQNENRIKNNHTILSKYDLIEKEYVFMTCHRASNTNNIENLIEILSSLSEIKEQIIFPIHPRTLKTIEMNNLSHFLKIKNLIITKPLGYFDTQTLISKAKFVLTDSGGVTKEAYFFKVPGILTDTQTEWIETIQEGWNHQAGPSKENILSTYANLSTPNYHSNCLGSGDASKKIAEILYTSMNGK